MFHVTPTGGMVTCNGYEKWLGECDSNNGNYICRPVADQFMTCVGDYPTVEEQIVGFQ